MHTVNFLEQLANNASFSEEAHKLISMQSNQIQKAFLENDAKLIKNKFSNVGYLANGVNVVEL